MGTTEDRIEECEAAIAAMQGLPGADVLIAREQAILNVLRRRVANAEKPAAEPFILYIIRPGAPGTPAVKQTVAANVVTIGSAKHNHVVVRGAQAIHVTLDRRAGTVWALNINTEGTGVEIDRGGTRIALVNAAPVHPGDHLVFSGDTRVVVNPIADPTA